MNEDINKLKFQPIGNHESQRKKIPEEYASWKETPSSETHTKVMKYLEPTISSAMTSYGTSDGSLKVRSKILADQALQTWDPQKGSTLKSHVFNHMKGLQRYRTQRQYAVHVPEQTRLDAHKVSTFEREYAAEHDREPTDQEIQDYLHMSKKRLERSRIKGELSSSQAMNEEGDVTMGSGRSYEDIWHDYVYHDLDAVNKKIFEWVSGHNGKPKLAKNEIARRLKITPAAVSQRVNTIQKRLQEGLVNDSPSIM